MTDYLTRNERYYLAEPINIIADVYAASMGPDYAKFSERDGFAQKVIASLQDQGWIIAKAGPPSG